MAAADGGKIKRHSGVESMLSIELDSAHTIPVYPPSFLLGPVYSGDGREGKGKRGECERMGEGRGMRGGRWAESGFRRKGGIYIRQGQACFRP